MKNKKVFRITAILLLDFLLAAAVAGGDYYYMYKMPRKLPVEMVQVTGGETFSGAAVAPGVEEPSGTAAAPGVEESSGTAAAPGEEEPSGTAAALGTEVPSGAASVPGTDSAAASVPAVWPFSDVVVSTDTVYRSPNVAIEISTDAYDSNVIDSTAEGKHIKYGSKIAYTIADIYIKDVTQLKTAFAKDTYGTGYSELLLDMSKRLGSILAVNGDSYSNNRHKKNGTIIRNGIVYRAKPSKEETCVLFQDGTMKIYGPKDFDPETVIEEGAWQSWIFGPSLLDFDGKAKEHFLTWDYIRQSHPRTAIGYYEPGHYCLVLVDGRQRNYSRGMYLQELSQLFESLGCKAAYNLDGGHCSFMTKGDQIISHPYKPKKEISDCIYITE